MTVPKYKAWIKEHKVMVPVAFIDFVDEEITIIDDTGIQRYFPFEDVEILQYIGLNDKNGNEIFRGDILEPEHGRSKGVYEVVWWNNGLMIKFSFMRKFEGEEFEDRSYLPIYADQYTVIGNVYEDSHLLEHSHE